MKYSPAQVRKTVVAGATFLVNLLTILLAVGGILPVVALPYVAVVLALAGTYGVYSTRNAPIGAVPDGAGLLARPQD